MYNWDDKATDLVSYPVLSFHISRTITITKQYLKVIHNIATHIYCYYLYGMYYNGKINLHRPSLIIDKNLLSITLMHFCIYIFIISFIKIPVTEILY